MRCEVLTGDCVEVMRGLPAGSVAAIVTDPPYGLEFMGKDWDSLGGRQRPYQPRGEGHANSGILPMYGRGGTSEDRDRFKRRANHAAQEWHEAWAREALRVLKPGGFLLAFGGTRTYHRLACAVEDAGFELRDEIMWLYGSGFPKSLDVSKAIDKAAGAEREVIGPDPNWRARAHTEAVYEGGVTRPKNLTEPSTDEAKRWDGWGTALKPAHEPIVVARKPLVGTVAGNVLAHGVGALNIDGCRIAHQGRRSPNAADGTVHRPNGAVYQGGHKDSSAFDTSQGRWPANVVLSHDEDCVLVGRREVRANGHFPGARGPSWYGAADGSNAGKFHGQDGLEERRFDGELVEVWACVPGCPVRMLDEQTGELRTGKLTAENQTRGGFAGTVNAYGTAARGGTNEYEASSGGASRFFYTAKASRAERNAGLDGFEKKPILWSSGEQNPGSFQAEGTDRSARNPHPTVKPIDLMRWLVRLVTPPDGLVLDPFAGSGSTGCAAVLEGFSFVGIEREAEYVPIAGARIRFWREHPTGLPVEVALVQEARRRKTRDAGQLGLEF